MRCDDEVQRKRNVSKPNLSKVERSILSNLDTELIRFWNISIKKTVLWFSSGEVWSVSFPLMGTDTQHHEKVDHVGLPAHTMLAKTKGDSYL
jgi:hypothetical protein